MARVFGNAQTYESAWTLIPGNAGLSMYRLEAPCPVTFDQTSGTPPSPQTLAPDVEFETIATPQTAGGLIGFDQTLGVWLGICVAGDATGHLALEAELSLLDPIIGTDYAVIRRILPDGSIPFQQA